MTSRAAREGIERAAAASPYVEWVRVRPRLEAQWKPGQHIAMFGPNGYGKTTVAIELGEISKQPTILLVTKKRDRLIAELPKRGWTLCRTLEQVENALKPRPGERYFHRGQARIPRIVFHPTATGGLRQRRAKLKTIVERLFDFVYDRGGVTVIIDEALFAVRNLRHGEQVEMLLHEARSGGTRLVLLSQRPSGLPLSAYSAPTYLVMFATNETEDLKRLSEIGGSLDKDALRDEIRLLPMYEFVLVAPRSKPSWSLRSSVPAAEKAR